VLEKARAKAKMMTTKKKAQSGSGASDDEHVIKLCWAKQALAS
jgi:hypothetical protein